VSIVVVDIINIIIIINFIIIIIIIITTTISSCSSYDDSIGVHTRLLAERVMKWSSISGKGKDFCPLHRVQNRSGTYPASYRIGSGDYIPGIKRAKREAHLKTASSVAVKNGGTIVPLPICLHEVMLH
jgi:hypothetical protein